MNISKDQYIDTVSTKLGIMRDAFKYGTLGSLGPELRDDYGVEQCFSNIIEVAGNTYDHNLRDSDGYRVDPLADNLANFSGVGYADVANVQTVGAIDVSIALKVDSLVPYVAVDRAMANPTDTIYFMNICASNEALESVGVSSDTIIAPNFGQLDTRVKLANKVATITLANATTEDTTYTVEFLDKVVPGTVTVTLTDGSTTVTGKDFTKNGVVYINGVSACTVDYSTGEVVISEVSIDSLDTSASKVVVQIDSQADSSGASILKAKSDWVNVQLTTAPHQIILEENAQVDAYMRKIAQNTSRINSQSDYTTLKFDKVVKMYKDSINRELIFLVWNATNAELEDSTSGAEAVTVDLSDYTVLASRNETRDDIINGLFIDMKAAFLKKTTMEPTVCITGTKGAAELARNATKWVRAPGYGNQLDGMCGMFDGTPIFRHHYLDELDSDTSQLTYYMAAKLPNNSSGSLVFGEFLSLIKTPTAQNYANPFAMSTGFYSQVGSKVIQPNLFQKGIVIKSSSSTSTESSAE